MSTPRTDHDIAMIFSKEGWVSPYWPMGVMALFCFFVGVVIDQLNKRLRFKSNWFGVGASLENMEEGLDNYWQSLSRVDKLWSEKEEYYKRHALGMPMMTDD